MGDIRARLEALMGESERAAIAADRVSAAHGLKARRCADRLVPLLRRLRRELESSPDAQARRAKEDACLMVARRLALVRSLAGVADSLKIGASLP